MNLNISLSSSEMTVDVFKDEIMQGNAGVVVNVTLPDIKGYYLILDIYITALVA